MDREAFSSAAQAARTALAEGAAAAANVWAASKIPSEIVSLGVGLGLVLLVPILAHRISSGGARVSGSRTPRRRHYGPRPQRTNRSPNTWAPRATPQKPVDLTSPITGPAYVIDGDTVVIRRIRVRLYGIDAPEMDQRGGAAARAHLLSLIARQPVTAIPIDVDIYGRTVARIEVAGTDICRAMVADGFAIAYRRYSTAYVANERAAREGQRGLWAECSLTGIESPAAHRYWSRQI